MINLCLIPVRGGSKGLPGKNAMPLIDDISLLEWTIRQALSSCLKNSILVSTEDPQLAEIASRCGVRVALRPESLAQDTSTTASVVEHVLKESDPSGTDIDAITILQVTSPLRRAADIDAATTLFQSGKYDSVVSGCEYAGVHPAKLYYASEGEVEPVAREFETCRRQDLPEIYRRNGAIFMVKRQYFEDTGRLWGGKTGMHKMPVDRSIDIDTLADLEAARLYLQTCKAAFVTETGMRS